MKYLKSFTTVVSGFCVFLTLVLALGGDTGSFFISLPFGLTGVAWLFREELGQ